MKTVKLVCVAIGIGVCMASLAAHAAPTFVWIEAETPTSADFAWKAGGATESSVLSEGQMFYRDGRAPLRDAGETVTYAFDASAAGAYGLWLRIGFEGLRPDVAWKLDDGAWTTIGAVDHSSTRAAGDTRKRDRLVDTTNVKEIGNFASVAWWRVGDADLKPGPHTLRLKFVNGLIPDPLLALDAICLVQGAWTPEGRLKPGEEYAGEADVKAAAQVYTLPTAAAGERSSVCLTGLWQVARFDDPNMDVDSYVPVQKLPTPEEYPLRWMGVNIPCNPWAVKELALGHRLIYRTRVDVPAGLAGRGFTLHFSGTAWIVSVFVNGKPAGTHRGMLVPWDLDVSRFVEPGKANEVAVAVKGSWYAWDVKHMPGYTLQGARIRPIDAVGGKYWVAPVYPSGKGDGDGRLYGIVNPVTLIATGDVYTDDVFVKPSVQRKELVVDVTVRNPGAKARRLSIACEAVNDRTGQTEKRFGPVACDVPAATTTVVSVTGAWADAKLWWPVPDPDLYRLRTRVLDGSTPVDTHEQLFGFREVTVQGTGLFLNGVRRNLWGWSDVDGPRLASPGDWAAKWREEGNRCIRFGSDLRIASVLPTREAMLDFFDRNGVAGRLCSMIDGMFISYYLGDRDGAFVPNEPVWSSFREHVDQMTRAYRNHPSILFYQIENELVYINGMNRLSGFLDDVEREMMRVYLAGHANDPTRPYSVGGGGDLRFAKDMNRALEINSPHYPDPAYDYYPDDAYRIEHYSSKISRWPWTRQQPWMPGESLFAAELQNGTYAAGPAAYRNRDEMNRAKARFVRMVYEGYRWAGVAGFFPWCNLSRYEDGQKVFSELSAIPRKRTWRLYGGRENRLLYKVMNDTFSRAPVTFEWQYAVDGKVVAQDRKTLAIEPGLGEEQTLVITPPAVAQRADGRLILKVSQEGAKAFADDVLVPTLPGVERLASAVPVSVYDKSGKVAPFLQKAGLAFQPVEDLAALRSSGRSGLLIVGPDSLAPGQAFGSDLLKFAVAGGQVIVLEQETPVTGGNVPVSLQATPHFYGYAHPQALGTTLFRDLGRDDLIDWAGDAPTCKNVYVKPTEGARSLVQCGPELPHSALIEVPAGAGVLVLCQMRVGAKLDLDPAAGVLLRNMVETYAGWKPPQGAAAVFAPGDALLADKLTATGALVEKVAVLEQGLDSAKYRVLVVDATRANLETLAGAKAKADAFQQAGGWIMVCNVRPDSIGAFNALVGTKHILRPFRIERVNLIALEHPLAATLSDENVAYLSTEVIRKSTGDKWVDWNTFSFCLDGMDAAPFTLPPGAGDDPLAYAPVMNDKDPYNFVNGMTVHDYWKYIRQIWVVKEGETDPEGKPGPIGLTHTFRLRQPETIRQINIWNNATYGTIENLDVVFDGDTANAVRIVLPDASELVETVLPQPREAKQNITLEIRSWRVKPNENPAAKNLVGIDNVQFLRAAAPSRGVSLDSVGGLVVFAAGAGQGGVLVNQLKFMKDEPNPVNAPKKVALLSTLLHNMGVGARAASAVAVPGVNIRYQTLDITDSCNAYRAEHERKAGWFGQKADLAALPKGENHFADVAYHVVDYATAPVPDCIVLTGWGDVAKETTGIKAGHKADVLFFLHGADVRRPITDEEREQMLDKRRAFAPPVLANYVIHYADGQTARIPVVLGQHVEHWLQKEPKPIPDAVVAWDVPMTQAGEGMRGVLYSMKAANPRPDVEIASIDVEVASQMVDVRGKGAVRQYQSRAQFGVVAISLGTLTK